MTESAETTAECVCKVDIRSVPCLSLRPGSLLVTGCPHQNQVDCDTQVIRSPVNVSSTIMVRLGKEQDGAEFSCEAQLALEQQPPPPMRSHSRSLRVHCEFCSVEDVCLCVCVCVYVRLFECECDCECKQGSEKAY